MQQRCNLQYSCVSKADWETQVISCCELWNIRHVVYTGFTIYRRYIKVICFPKPYCVNAQTMATTPEPTCILNALEASWGQTELCTYYFSTAIQHMVKKSSLESPRPGWSDQHPNFVSKAVNASVQ